MLIKNGSVFRSKQKLCEKKKYEEGKRRGNEEKQKKIYLYFFFFDRQFVFLSAKIIHLFYIKDKQKIETEKNPERVYDDSQSDFDCLSKCMLRT